MTHSIPCPAHGHQVTPSTACPACVGNYRAGGEHQRGGWTAPPVDPIRLTLARAYELSYSLAAPGLVPVIDDPPLASALSMTIAGLADALLAVLNELVENDDWSPISKEWIREVLQNHLGN